MNKSEYFESHIINDEDYQKYVEVLDGEVENFDVDDVLEEVIRNSKGKGF